LEIFKMAVEIISISDLDRNGLQTRCALNEQTVVDYAEAMKERAKFPPVKVFCDGEKFYLADGFHRVEAALRFCAKKIKADVSPGGFVDALRYALKANADHGLRRTNEDKRRTLEMAWEHREELFGGEPSHALLAEACGVSESSVRRFREEINPVQRTRLTPAPKAAKNALPPPPVKRVGVDGKTRTVPQKPSVPPPAPKAKQTPCRKGYYIGPDGKEHAIGVELDRFNVEIPPKVKGAFTVGAEAVKNWITRCWEVKNEIERAVKDGFSVSIPQRAIMELDNAYHELNAALPHCVCRLCQGRGCNACAGLGYQTKDQYARNPKEFKA
jgi:hypothetical protein